MSPGFRIVPKLRLLVLAIAALAPLAFASAASSAAAAPAPGLIEVGPGIYIAAASDLPPFEPVPAPETGSATASTFNSAGPAQAFVVGGKKTTIRRWPWQVSLQYPAIAPGNQRRSHSCGGSLVAPNVVVTAAHCLTLGSENFRPPEEFQVISGRTRLSTDQGRVHELADYYYFADAAGNPLWDRDTVTWDVVFLILASDARQTPVKIAGAGEEANWAPGTRSYATGWGVTRESGDEDEVVLPSNVLRLARVRMISDSACNDVYGAAFVSSLMVCAGERLGGVDVCGGDSGGPLVVRVQGGYRLIGSTSFADGCGVPGVPGVYGRLATDPIRGALANGIRVTTGAEILGAGAAASNAFSLRFRRAGGRIVVGVPSRGVVELLADRRVRGETRYPSAAGRISLRVRPRGKLKRRVLRRGRAGAVVEVRFRPFNGNPRTKRVRVHLTRSD